MTERSKILYYLIISYFQEYFLIQYNMKDFNAQKIETDCRNCEPIKELTYPAWDSIEEIRGMWVSSVQELIWWNGTAVSPWLDSPTE